MNKMFLVAAAITLIGSQGSAWAAGDAAAGKEKTAACAACHAADGNSTIAANPKLAGQHADYIVKQLQEFKSGARKNPIMTGQAAALSEKDMEDIGAFYASQSPKPGKADEKLVAQGEKLYRGGNPGSGVAACIGCHGPSGKGNPAAKFPALSGQHAEYTTKQLQDFQAGARDNDAGSMMRNIAAKLSKAEMQALASYIAGLH